jgi:hypothetical protein
VLALRAAGRSPQSPPVRRAATWIAGQANNDGGFNFAGRGGPSGVDDTGAALQALGAAGRRASAVARRAVRFLERNQAADGGFALIPGGPSNAQSTAWAVQGLLAAGRDPAAVRRNGSRDPMSYLRSLTAPSGEVRYSRTSRQTPVWVTAQAVMALSRRPLPLAAVPRDEPGRARRARTSPPRRRPKPQSLPPVGPAGGTRAAVTHGTAAAPAGGDDGAAAGAAVAAASGVPVVGVVSAALAATVAS